MHRFKWGQDLKDTYDAAPYSRGGIYCKGNIYYTNTASGTILTDTSRNIIGVDAVTGKLAYRDMPLRSESLETNPIIAHDKMYVPYMNGLRVYDLTTHKIIGEDPSFYGFATGHNLLYKDYMITFLRDAKLYGGGAKVVAVYVGE